jgi:hypothetical protein
MIEIVTKSGKRIGRISDSLDQDDTVVIDGKEIALADVYADNKLRTSFNDHVKELQDGRKDNDTRGDTK